MQIYDTYLERVFALPAYCEANRPGLRSKTAAFRF